MLFNKDSSFYIQSSNICSPSLPIRTRRINYTGKNNNNENKQWNHFQDNVVVIVWINSVICWLAEPSSCVAGTPKYCFNLLYRMIGLTLHGVRVQELCLEPVTPSSPLPITWDAVGQLLFLVVWVSSVQEEWLKPSSPRSYFFTACRSCPPNVGRGIGKYCSYIFWFLSWLIFKHL